MANEVRTYKLERVEIQKNQKRVINEIKKIKEIKTVKVDKNTETFLIELASPDFNQADIDKIEESLLKSIRKYDKKATFTLIENLEVYRKVLYLKGLDCAYCGTRIEAIAKKELSYEKILVDFASFRFIIETRDKELIDHIEERVTKIAHQVDDRIEVINSEVSRKERIEENHPIKPWRIILLTIGGILSFIGVFWSCDFNFKELFTLMLHTEKEKTELGPVLLMISGYLMIGYRVIWGFVKNLFKGRVFDENFLMTIASIGAIITGHYFEAIMVMALYQIGEGLQEKAVNHSRKSISNLLNIDVQYAKLKVGTEITEIEVESVLPDDIIVVQKGEMIPLDGKITDGKGLLDTKNLTGESILRTAEIGDEIMAGSINMGSVIEIQVLRPYSESMITKILDMVENASSKKAKAENFITKFSRYYTPVVISIAFLVAALGFSITYFTSLASGQADLERALSYIYQAMVFLVISCPCALVISIPLCFFSSIGLASKRGILIKGSNYLEALNNVENCVFDKTGTLTKGEFDVIEVEVHQQNVTEEELIRLLMYVEYYSTHPIGISIVDKYGRNQIIPDIIEDFSEVTSRGAKATVNGRRIVIGNNRMMQELKMEHIEKDVPGLQIHIVRDKVYLGFVVIGDAIRDEAAKTVSSLRRQGIRELFILTGDAKGIAENVANIIGIDTVKSELLPDEKVSAISEIMDNRQNKHGKTIYVGDGINDAPVISAADVGIAMGTTGSDATIAIADVVIMSDNLEKLDELINIAKLTRKKVIQNIVFSLGIKIIVMILGLIESVQLPLSIAIFSDVGVSLIAIANSLLITRMFNKKDFKKQPEVKNEIS